MMKLQLELGFKKVCGQDIIRDVASGTEGCKIRFVFPIRRMLGSCIPAVWES